MNITDFIAGYENKEFSPVNITKKFLNRIERQSKLNAYISVNSERAINQAEISEKKIKFGEQLGLFEGIPISFKDNIETKGGITTNGSIIYNDLVIDVDAYIVHKMFSEGAINLGKTTLPEFVFSVKGNNPHYGFVKNPWNHDYSSGGSSSGSAAAVAANLCVASVGTDTTGSIRIPAASCGIVGLKPTFSYIDMTGIKPHSWTLDNLGPLAKNMTDLAWMMEAMTGDEFIKECVDNIEGLRVGVPKNYFNEHVDSEVKKLYETALKSLEELGANLVDIDIPFGQANIDHLNNVVFAECSFTHKDNIERYGNIIGDYIKDLLKPGHSITAFQYIDGLNDKDKVLKNFEKLYDEIDIIATPTLPTTAARLETEEVDINGFKENVVNSYCRFVQVFNVTDQPALSIPCGISSEGLPVGLQLVARRFDDSLLIRVGYSYEKNYLQEFYDSRNIICKTDQDY